MSALQCQQDAARVATTADVAVTEERHLTCRVASALFVADQPDMARKTVTRGVERQGRMAGCGSVHLPEVEASTARAYVVVVGGVQL